MAAPRVTCLTRYPIKSMVGEDAAKLEFDRRGIVGDRLWSVRTETGKIGSGKNTRRFAAVPGLLQLRACFATGADTTEAPYVVFADGEASSADDPATAKRLSGILGQPVRLARETDVSHFDDGSVSIIGAASVDNLSAEREAEVDPVRFRANIVVSTATAHEEQAWIGRELRIGTTTLRVTLPSLRCVMIDMETADLPEQPGNLKAIGSSHDTTLGVIAEVVRPGVISLGDELTIGEIGDEAPGS